MRPANVRRTDRRWPGFLMAAAAILAFWAFVALLVQRPVVPAPRLVIAFLAGGGLAPIMPHCAASLGRVALGLSLSLIIGVPVGLAMGYFPGVGRILDPLVYLTYPVPKIALLPVVMLLFGLGEGSKAVMIMLIVIFQVVIACRDAARDIDPDIYRTLRSMGARKRHIFIHVVMPATAPRLISAVRVGMGTSLSVLFFTETYGTELGMGYYVMDAWMRMNYVELYAGILVLGLVGFLLFFLLDGLERLLCPWNAPEMHEQ